MTGGTPRGVDEVIMRDPVELGGVPRADRYSSNDWLHNTINLPNSAILRSIRFPVLSMTIWGFAIAFVHRHLVKIGKADIAANMCIPTQPHSLMVSALGLLLVFRTNSAYQRFAEGRVIWEQILSTARDLSRLGKLYENQIGVQKWRRVQRLLAAFPYLLRFRIRPNSIMKRLDDTEFVRDPEFSLILYQDHAVSDSDAEAAAVASVEETTGMSRRKPRELYWVDKRTLPWRLLPTNAIDECARAQNRPLWVCDRMAKELHSVPDNGTQFTARERLTLLSKVDALSRTVGACERIHQTVVPLNYARHALRSLSMWLVSLPFALVKDMGLMTGPILFVISWMLFGVYEIGYSIEDPFQGTLRLSILCDAIRRDVLGDEIIRNTAFVVEEEKSVSSSSVISKTETRVLSKDDDDDNDDDDDDEEVVVDIEEIKIDALGNIFTDNSGLDNLIENVIQNVTLQSNETVENLVKP
jgi:predicted membrane chloride channel (bestrophin family)